MAGTIWGQQTDLYDTTFRVQDESQLYKSCASQSRLNGAEVVGVIAPLSTGEITVHEDGVTIEETIAEPITIEQPSQEEL
jgi:hypothetical protein